MIIVMKESASTKEIDDVNKFIEDNGMKPVLLHGTNKKVFALIGENRSIDIDHVNAMSGVEKAIRILTPYKFAGKQTDGVTTVRINNQILGGKQIGVIAGPCSIESKDQIIEIAERVKEAGAIALRGGAYKPRTSPYAFQGLGVEGLEYLALAREKTGLPIVTEILSPDKVSLIAEYADVFQIGARNMQNYKLLEAVGMTSKPVLLKRGISSTMDETLLAAEYILSKGNPNVMVCERGIRTFEQHVRFTLPLASVPYIQENSHMPVIVDPSHGTGKRSLVTPMARAAVAAGADGLIIEVHTNPGESTSDAAQTLSCEEFADLMKQIKPVAEAVGREM